MSQAMERMSADQFLSAPGRLGDGRHELVAGRVVKLAPERNKHVDDKMRVWLVLRNAVAASGLNLHVSGDGVSVRIDDTTVREPDALIQSQPDPLSTEANAPVVVVEIVSPSSDATDNIAKLDEYLRVSTVAAYLVIDTYAGRVAVHTREDDQNSVRTQVVRAGTISLDTPPIELSVADLLGS